MNQYLQKQHQKMLASGVLTPYFNRWEQWLSGQFQGQGISKENIEYGKYMDQVSHTKEESFLYWENIAALFTKLSSVDSPNLLKKIQEQHTAYVTGNTHRKDFIAIAVKRTDTAFEQMEKYWRKLLNH